MQWVGRWVPRTWHGWCKQWSNILPRVISSLMVTSSLVITSSLVVTCSLVVISSLLHGIWFFHHTYCHYWTKLLKFTIPRHDTMYMLDLFSQHILPNGKAASSLVCAKTTTTTTKRLMRGENLYTMAMAAKIYFTFYIPLCTWLPAVL